MVRFVTEVIEGTLVVTRRPIREVLQELQKRGYTPFPPQQKKKVSSTTIQQEDEGEGGPSVGASAGADEMMLLDPEQQLGAAEGELRETPETHRAVRDYDYLLGMRLWSLTAEVSARLSAQLKSAQEKYEDLERRTPKDLWQDDLALLRPRIEKLFDDRTKEIASIQRKKKEKHRPFDPSNLRVPLLSDKAREALMKETIKEEKKSGRVAAGVRTDEVGGGSTAQIGTRSAAGTKPRARAKRKRRDSDDEDESFELDESGDDDGWRPDDNNEGPSRSTSAGAGSGGKKQRAPRAPKSTAPKQIIRKAKVETGASSNRRAGWRWEPATILIWTPLASRHLRLTSPRVPHLVPHNRRKQRRQQVHQWHERRHQNLCGR
ncbi:putative DNA gyrase topoisomerase IV subunit A [Trypanosoma vivax]|nr:putative DNA gyrase topoisomerase IV subunit A [Trypanosoma vivax]